MKNPKSNYNACGDFLETVIVGHILSAAMKILKVSNLNDQPSDDVIGITSAENLWTYTNEERKRILAGVCEKVVDKFINFSFNAPPADGTPEQDEVHNYACNLLSIGCFYLTYRDAIKEGDGKRVLDCWHYLLPIFRNSGRRNYANEAFLFLCQYYYDLPQQQAEQMLYSRFVNTKGVRGRNIPLDLYQEHLNRLCKECVKGLGSNKTKESIVRCSKAMGILQEMLDNFDKSNNVSIPSGAHQPLSYHQDLQLITEQLQQSRIFDIIPKRKHQHFKKPKNLLHAKSSEDIVSWLCDHLKQKYF